MPRAAKLVEIPVTVSGTCRIRQMSDEDEAGSVSGITEHSSSEPLVPVDVIMAEAGLIGDPSGRDSS
jgi:hypothetical protein